MVSTSFHKRFLVALLVLSLAFLVFDLGRGQDTKTRLEQDKQKIEEEIQYNSKLLEETQKSKKTTLNQLVILKNQISSREQLIETLHLEISAANEQIGLNDEILSDLKNDLTQLKDEYALMIYYAYKNRSSFDKLMFIFSAADFNQAYLRLKYYQQYSSYRKTQAQLILETQNEINKTQQELDLLRKEKIELVAELEAERDRLAQNRYQQNNIYRTLNRKEKELARTIKEKEDAAKKLQKEIENIIAEEIRLASKKAGTTATSSYALTPAELALSTDFQDNMGALPWPTAQGVISETFGEHEHPVLKQVKTKNNGIDIVTDENAKARAIFGGEVTRVMSIPNYNYVVMIRHGEFLSVYSNLAEVSVSKGDKVTIKQEIGVIHTDTKEAKTELHFELWKGKTLLNPANWLAK